MPLEYASSEPPANDVEPEANSLHNELADLADEMRITHEFLVQGRSEWELITAVSHHLAPAGGQLEGLKLTRFGREDICLTFRVSGLTPEKSRHYAHSIQYEAGVVRCRVEHTILQTIRR